MEPMTAAQLHAALPLCDAAAWIGHINVAMVEFGVNTARRRAMFLAQAGHESGQFTHLVENLNYSAERLMAVFLPYFPDRRTAQIFAHWPERIANRVYSGRLGNGDEASGDGWTYRGRGLIQITGRRNYALCGDDLGLPLLEQPDQLELPRVAARSAAWFFVVQAHGFRFADEGDIKGATRAVNGGVHGLADRAEIYHRALEALA